MRPLAAITLLLVVGCSEKARPPVERLGDGVDVSRFTLTSLRGARAGDHLDAQVTFGDGSQQLNAVLRFRVGVPTKLESGTWSGLPPGGAVRERSVTFLGGQSGPPSLGGRFDLLGPNGDPLYRITIPLRPLDRPI